MICSTGLRSQFRWFNFAFKPGRRERNFWMRRQGAKFSRQNERTRTETKIREMSGRKSPQKRLIWPRIENLRFAKTGWWCAQSDANPSPCYLANIRVIFGKNREPAAENVKNACSTRTLRNSDISISGRNREPGGPVSPTSHPVNYERCR